MKRLITNTVFILTLLISCYSCKKDASTSETSTIKLEGLTLNNSKKWVANQDTHIGMQRIDSILKNNISKDGKTVGQALSKQTSYIIKSCNMTGEAHDQLHIVLVPILEAVGDLKDTKNASIFEKKMTTLQQLTATYFKYFKI